MGLLAGRLESCVTLSGEPRWGGRFPGGWEVGTTCGEGEDTAPQPGEPEPQGDRQRQRDTEARTRGKHRLRVQFRGPASGMPSARGHSTGLHYGFTVCGNKSGTLGVGTRDPSREHAFALGIP